MFQKDGKFVKEGIVSKDTRGATVTGQFGVVSSHGSVWDIAFSNDAQQRYIFVADGHDKKVSIVQRDTLAEVGSVGAGGRQPGQFLAVGSIAVDSRGNIYTGEQHHGKRVQKFVPGRYSGQHGSVERERRYEDSATCSSARHSSRCLAALGVGQSAAAADAAAQAKGAVQAPRFEVDPMWPQAAAERLVSRPDDRRVGSTRRITSGSSIAPTSLDAVEAAADEAADRRVLQEGAAGPRVRRSGQLLRHWGGADGAGLQWPESNHGIYDRPQGQRLDRRQRPATTAWS